MCNNNNNDDNIYYDSHTTLKRKDAVVVWRNRYILWTGTVVLAVKIQYFNMGERCVQYITEDSKPLPKGNYRVARRTSIGPIFAYFQVEWSGLRFIGIQRWWTYGNGLHEKNSPVQDNGEFCFYQLAYWKRLTSSFSLLRDWRWRMGSSWSLDPRWLPGLHWPQDSHSMQDLHLPPGLRWTWFFPWRSQASLHRTAFRWVSPGLCAGLRRSAGSGPLRAPWGSAADLWRPGRPSCWWVPSYVARAFCSAARSSTRSAIGSPLTPIYAAVNGTPSPLTG